SSLPCPRSIVTAMISALYFSAIHGIATDVSSPPEYAKTIRSITAPSAQFSSLRSPTCETLQTPRQRCRATRIPCDDENRIVALNRTNRLRQLRAINRLGKSRGLPSSGAKNDELLHAIRAAEELSCSALERRKSRFRVPFVFPGPSVRAVARALDQPQLFDVARDRCLRRVEAALTQTAAQLLLTVERIAIDEFQDDGLAARFHEAQSANYTSIFVDPTWCGVYNFSFRCILSRIPNRQRQSRRPGPRHAWPLPARRDIPGKSSCASCPVIRPSC